MQNYPSNPSNANKYPQNHKRGCLDFLKSQIWGGVSAIVAIAALFVALISIPRLAPARQILSQALSGTPAPTPTIAPTPTPTPAPITITENSQIPCVQCEYPVGLELQSIDINRNDNTSAFHFKVTDNYSSGLTESFSQLSLQDDNGNTHNAGGGDANNIGPGNSVI